MKDRLDSLIKQMVDSGISFKDAVTELEKGYLKKVLEINRGNQSRAADALGIHRNTLSRKMEEFKLHGENGNQPARVGKRKKS